MKIITHTILTLLLLSGVDVASAQSVKERVAALKSNVATCKLILQQYEWIQTTTVNHNGHVVSTKQDRCYYGDDGTLQKVEISDDQAPQRQGLLFRRIKQDIKNNMTDYMLSAVALVKTYVPPRASLIQAAKDAGNVSFQPLGGHRGRIVFQSYEKPGDTYTIEVNLADNRPVALRVNTYVDDPSDPVTMKGSMGQLENGTTFPQDITLNADNEGITITVHNGGYRRRN